MSSFKPILFSTPLVRAILEGRKTETRRVLRLPQPVDPGQPRNRISWVGWPCDGDRSPQHRARKCEAPMPGHHHMHYANGFNWLNDRCPYGVPGDVLWVRETWKPFMEAWRCGVEYKTGAPALVDHDVLAELAKRSGIDLRFYGASKEHHNPRWRPSIHMPKWAARIFLRVDEVRVERLQDITAAGAIAEGIECDYDVSIDQLFATIDDFARLWDGLAKPGTRWEDNPWVWVVRFHRIDRPEGWPEVTP